MFGKEQFPVVLLTFLPTEAVGKTNPVLWGLCSERKQLHDGAIVEGLPGHDCQDNTRPLGGSLPR